MEASCAIRGEVECRELTEVLQPQPYSGVVLVDPEEARRAERAREVDEKPRAVCQDLPSGTASVVPIGPFLNGSGMPEIDWCPARLARARLRSVAPRTAVGYRLCVLHGGATTLFAGGLTRAGC